MTSIRDLSNEAAEAIRAANYQSTEGMVIGDVYAIVNQLGDLARNLHQLISELDRVVHHRIDSATGLRHDRDGDPIATLHHASDWLTAAARPAGAASECLYGALIPLSHIADPPNHPDDEDLDQSEGNR